MSEVLVLGTCANSIGPYHHGVHAKRTTCRHFESVDNINQRIEQGTRAKIDRERGIYPSVASVITSDNTLGFCAESPRHAHRKYTLCRDWNPAGILGKCRLGGEYAHTRDKCLNVPDWKPMNAAEYTVPTRVDGDILPKKIGGQTQEFSAVAAVEEDYQKNLREFRASMGNPIPPVAASPRQFFAVDAMQNNDAQQKSPDYLFRIDMSVVENRVYNWGSTVGFCDNGPCAHKKDLGCKNWWPCTYAQVGKTLLESTPKKVPGGYATLMTGMELLTGWYPEKFPETPEQTDSRRDREWNNIHKAIRSERENFLSARAQREKEQRIRRNERLRIATIIEHELNLAPRERRSRKQTIAYLRSL